MWRRKTDISKGGATIYQMLTRATVARAKNCSDNNLKFPPIGGGLDASDGGAVAPPSPSLAPPLLHSTEMTNSASNYCQFLMDGFLNNVCKPQDLCTLSLLGKRP